MGFLPKFTVIGVPREFSEGALEEVLLGLIGKMVMPNAILSLWPMVTPGRIVAAAPIHTLVSMVMGAPTTLAPV